MAEHVYIDNLHKYVGKEVELKGWLYNKRSSGKLHFLQLRDGTGIVQSVMSKAEIPEADFVAEDKALQETSLTVTGVVREDKRSPIGVELGVQKLHVVALPTAEFPISPKDHGTAFLMEQRHLWLRSRRQVAILRIRAEIVRQIRNYFDSRGF